MFEQWFFKKPLKWGQTIFTSFTMILRKIIIYLFYLTKLQVLKETSFFNGLSSFSRRIIIQSSNFSTTILLILLWSWSQIYYIRINRKKSVPFRVYLVEKCHSRICCHIYVNFDNPSGLKLLTALLRDLPIFRSKFDM